MTISIVNITSTHNDQLDILFSNRNYRCYLGICWFVSYVPWVFSTLATQIFPPTLPSCLSSFVVFVPLYLLVCALSCIVFSCGVLCCVVLSCLVLSWPPTNCNGLYCLPLSLKETWKEWGWHRRKLIQTAVELSICCMPPESLEAVRFRLTRDLAQRTARRQAQVAAEHRKGLRVRTFGNEDEIDEPHHNIAVPNNQDWSTCLTVSCIVLWLFVGNALFIQYVLWRRQ